MSEAPSSCPFCGGDNILAKVGMALCMTCGAAAKIAAWNRRAPGKDAEDWAERAALAASRERAAIVAWLRPLLVGPGGWVAAAIERGEHLPAKEAAP